MAIGYTSGDERKLNVAGGTMTGPLILADDPTDDLEAATKQYVDAVTTAATGDMLAANNLSDVASASTSRTNLGLGGAATLNVGATAGTVAGGDDSRITGALQAASNLSDLANAGTARTNLGLGGAATLAVGTTTGTVAAGDDSRFTALAATAVKTSSYTAAANEFVPVDTTSGSVTITLPAAPADGTRIGVKHVVRGSTNTVTVARGGSDVFNVAAGATTTTLTVLFQSATFVYKATGAIWYVTSADVPLAQTDARYAQLANNLSDLASASTARTNLGLGGAATLAVGTTAGTVAAGDDSRFASTTVTAVKTSNYTAAAGEFVPVDTTSGSVTVTLPTAPADGTIIRVKHVIRGSTNTVTIARGGSDVFNVAGTTSYTLTLVLQGVTLTYKSSTAIWYVSDSITLAQLDARHLQISNNLSDLASASTARTNLGLGGAAVLAVGTTAGTVAAGDDSRMTNTRTPSASSITDAMVASPGLAPSSLNLATWTPSDHGFLTWSIDPALAGTGSTLSNAGVMHLIKVKLPVAGTISTVCLFLTALASGSPANCYAALYDSGGTRRAVTADLTTPWTASTGYLEHNFASSYSAAAGTYYVGLLCGAASTQPSFSRNASTIASNAGLSAPGLRFSVYGSSQTSAPSSVTLASATATTSAASASYFVGLK